MPCPYLEDSLQRINIRDLFQRCLEIFNIHDPLQRCLGVFHRSVFRETISLQKRSVHRREHRRVRDAAGLSDALKLLVHRIAPAQGDAPVEVQ